MNRERLVLVFTLILLFTLFVIRVSERPNGVVKSDRSSEIPADANSDNIVDGVDYAIWLKNLDKDNPNGKLEGDFNQDGIVSSEDYEVWQSNYKDRININLSSQSKVLGFSTNVGFWEKIRNNISLFFNNLKGKILPEPKVISFKDARKFAGKEKIVEGEIKEIINNRKAVYLGFAKPHTGFFVVRILEENWKNFPDVPDKIYKEGQKIRVSGKIEWYQGDPVIYVENPSQIVVLSD